MSPIGDWLRKLDEEADGFLGEVERKMQSEFASKIAEEAVNMIFDDGETSAPPAQETYVSQPNKRPSGYEFGELQENLAWSYGTTAGTATPFTLSAPMDHYHTSDVITTLCPDEFLFFKFRVLRVEPKGDYSNNIQFLINNNGGESGWSVRFNPNEDLIKEGCLKLNGKFTDKELELSSYLPNQQNTGLIYYWAGGSEIKFLLNMELINEWIVVSEHTPRTIQFRVVGMDACFWGN